MSPLTFHISECFIAHFSSAPCCVRSVVTYTCNHLVGLHYKCMLNSHTMFKPKKCILHKELLTKFTLSAWRVKRWQCSFNSLLLNQQMQDAICFWVHITVKNQIKVSAPQVAGICCWNLIGWVDTVSKVLSISSTIGVDRTCLRCCCITAEQHGRPSGCKWDRAKFVFW